MNCVALTPETAQILYQIIIFVTIVWAWVQFMKD